MDSKILLGRILQKLEDNGKAKVPGYNTFKRVKEKENSIILLRENGNEATIPFKTILLGIEYYKMNTQAYDKGPTELRKASITHITSPVYALLHLIPKHHYVIK